jgi:hypothetical protein
MKTKQNKNQFNDFYLGLFPAGRRDSLQSKV